MNVAEKTGGRGVVSALLRSYAADLRGWIARLVTGYAVAAVMLLGGVVLVFASVAVGIAALFHLIELRYGTDIAYAAVGGGLLLFGVILLLVGWATLHRRSPPLPRPRRQAQAAKRMMIGPAAWRAVAGLRGAQALRTDTVTQVLVGAAATVLAGWIVASRLQARSMGRRVRQ